MTSQTEDTMHAIHTEVTQSGLRDKFNKQLKKIIEKIRLNSNQRLKEKFLISEKSEKRKLSKLKIAKKENLLTLKVDLEIVI